MLDMLVSDSEAGRRGLGAGPTMPRPRPRRTVTPSESSWACSCAAQALPPWQHESCADVNQADRHGSCPWHQLAAGAGGNAARAGPSQRRRRRRSRRGDSECPSLAARRSATIRPAGPASKARAAVAGGRRGFAAAFSRFRSRAGAEATPPPGECQRPMRSLAVQQRGDARWPHSAATSRRIDKANVRGRTRRRQDGKSTKLMCVAALGDDEPAVRAPPKPVTA